MDWFDLCICFGCTQALFNVSTGSKLDMLDSSCVCIYGHVWIALRGYL